MGDHNHQVGTKLYRHPTKGTAQVVLTPYFAHFAHNRAAVLHMKSTFMLLTSVVVRSSDINCVDDMVGPGVLSTGVRQGLSPVTYRRRLHPDLYRLRAAPASMGFGYVAAALSLGTFGSGNDSEGIEPAGRGSLRHASRERHDPVAYSRSIGRPVQIYGSGNCHCGVMLSSGQSDLY